MSLSRPKAPWLASLALAACACAPAPKPPSVRIVEAPPRPVRRFPSRSDLAAIAPAPPPAELARPGERAGERWQLDEASLPGSLAAPPPAALGRHVGALSGDGRPLAPSGPLACAAREFSRFRLAKGASPAEGLRRYVLAHCGSTLPSAAYAYVQGEAGPKLGDDEILREALPKLRAGLAGPLPENTEVGVALAREGGRVVVSMLSGAAAIDLAPVAPLPAAGEAVARLTGTLPGRPRVVMGIINRGAVGVAPCALAGGVAPPRFELQCPVAADDQAAWVDVVTHEPERPSFDRVARVLLRRPGPRAPYAPAAVGAPAPARDDAEFRREVVARVNELRRAGGAPPLEPAEAQSASNARLAGPYFNAELAGDRGLAARIALGLSAGWDVDGLVRQGHFGAFAAPSNDAAAWLGDVLEQPLGRRMLLGPDQHLVALGPAPGRDALAALVTTYALFRDGDRGAEAERVLASLAARRADRGLPPPTRLADFAPLQNGARRFERGEPAQQALDGALAEATSRFGREVYGTVTEVGSLADVAFPAQLFDRLAPHVAVEVGHRRAPGEAWGHFAAFLVVVPREVRDDYRRPPRAKDEPVMPDSYVFPRAR